MNRRDRLEQLNKLKAEALLGGGQDRLYAQQAFNIL